MIIAPPSGANLNISPKRVTFDRNRRSGSIYIFNQGSAPGTFDISLVDRVMLPDGQILPLTDAQTKPENKAVADQVKSARTILQVSPRRVTLSPGQGQTIRLRVITAPAEPGVVELRSHLTISTLPPRDSGTTAEAAATAAPSGELRFQINALLGLSVPAIVRLNDPDIRAGIENARITYEQLSGPKGPATPVLNLDDLRQGAPTRCSATWRSAARACRKARSSASPAALACTPRSIVARSASPSPTPPCRGSTLR